MTCRDPPPPATSTAGCNRRALRSQHLNPIPTDRKVLQKSVRLTWFPDAPNEGEDLGSQKHPTPNEAKRTTSGVQPRSAGLQSSGQTGARDESHQLPDPGRVCLRAQLSQPSPHVQRAGNTEEDTRHELLDVSPTTGKRERRGGGQLMKHRHRTPVKTGPERKRHENQRAGRADWPDTQI